MYSNQGYVHDNDTGNSLPTSIGIFNVENLTNPPYAREPVLEPNPKVDKTCHKQRLKNIGLFVADQLFAGLVVGPLTVYFWWGFWNILARYLYPDDLYMNAITCMVIGNCGLVFLALSQEMWKKFLPVDRSWLAWIFGFHGYVAICGFFNVCHWKGVWAILDHYTGTGLNNFWVTYAIGQSSLWFFKSSKSAQAPPMIVVSDRTSSLFSHIPRFKTEPAFSTVFLYDVLFTVVVINQLVVFYWRGAWGLLDELLLKENPFLSTWAGFGFGYLLMFLLCFVQPLFNLLFTRAIRKLESRPLKPVKVTLKFKQSYNCQQSTVEREVTSTSSNNNFDPEPNGTQKSNWECALRWFLDVIVCFLSNAVNVVMWRSVWRVCDEYLSWDKDAGNATGICVGLGVLIVLTCSPSLLIRGCDVEGDEAVPPENVGFAPNYYFRLFRFKLGK